MLLSEKPGHLSDPVILGIDPSIRSTGLCTDSEHRAVRYEKADTDWDGEDRIRLIAEEILGECSRAEVSLAVIEDAVNTGKLAGNSLTNLLLQGAIRFVLMSNNIPYLVVSPSLLKKFATGKGNADKTEMALSAYKRSGFTFETSDECDAWWLLQFGRAWVDQSLLQISLPKDQLSTVSKARLVGQW